MQGDILTYSVTTIFPPPLHLSSQKHMFILFHFLCSCKSQTSFQVFSIWRNLDSFPHCHCCAEQGCWDQHFSWEWNSCHTCLALQKSEMMYPLLNRLKILWCLMTYNKFVGRWNRCTLVEPSCCKSSGTEITTSCLFSGLCDKPLLDPQKLL